MNSHLLGELLGARKHEPLCGQPGSGPYVCPGSQVTLVAESGEDVGNREHRLY